MISFFFHVQLFKQGNISRPKYPQKVKHDPPLIQSKVDILILHLENDGDERYQLCRAVARIK